MKKLVLIIGSLAFFQYFGFAQKAKKKGAEEKLKKTEIELVYNHYIQDGDNSAVTGGEGTEELKVYGPSLSVKKSLGIHKVTTKIGADVITSASTDNIDFVLTSASRVDIRAYGNLEYARTNSKRNLEIYGGVGMSIESDYLSVASKLGISKQDKNRLKTYSAQFQFFNDDLRWGRVNSYVKELRLVYPSELRYKKWYEEYKRQSYNLKLGYTQIINKRSIVGLYPELTYQNGLLATPFHRVYFINGGLGVEQLPSQRFKAAVALKWNSFVKGNLILKNAIGLYSDNFGVRSFSISNETAIKLTPIVTVMPNFRFYTQKGSDYFNGFNQHNNQEEFYTSDYDFATHKTYQAGMGVRYSPGNYLHKQFKFNTVMLRYSFYYRDNGLTAHILSVAFRSEFIPKNKKERRKLQIKF